MRSLSKASTIQVMFVGCVAFTTMISLHAFSADAIALQSPANFDERSWKIIVSPYIWAASLNGHTSVAGHHADVDIPFNDVYKNLDLSMMGNVEITNGIYGFYFDGQYTKVSQDADFHSLTLGVDITSTTLSTGAFFRAIEVPLDGMTIFGNQRLFTVEPTAGVRWTQLKADFDLVNWSASRKLEWTDPFIGLRINTDLTERWNLSAEADVGGFREGSDMSAQGQAYLGYRTHVFNQPTLLRLGYRALYQNYEGGDVLGHKFRWDVTQHGPVAGVSFVF